MIGVQQLFISFYCSEGKKNKTKQKRQDEKHPFSQKYNLKIFLVYRVFEGFFL